MNILFCCTDTNADPWLELLRQALPKARISVWQPGEPATADYAVVWFPPQRFVNEQRSLRALFNIGAGVDAIVKLDLPTDLKVVRLDDAGMSVQMAEYVCHAVIRHFREFDAYAAAARDGEWAFRRPLKRTDFPVGIMGLGVLGQRVAQALAAFEFPLTGWSRTPREVPGMRCFAGAQQLAAFLAATRVLVCLLPLTAQTEGILCRDTLSKLQSGGYVINVARGGHLVEDDLLALLGAGRLAGATLDVFREEPLPPEHPFWRHPAITVTPHMSARTLRAETVAQIAAKIEALERGEAIAGVVDRQVGY